MNRTVPTLLVAALVLLAGCAGGIPGQSGTQTQMADSGTVQFYVSDEKNAIDQFEHLNVTITKIGFAQSGDADANASASEDMNSSTGEDVERDSDDGLTVSLVGNVTAGENATVKVTHDGEAVENATVTVDDADVTVTTDADGTATVQVPADAEEFAVTASTDEDSEVGEAEAELELEFGEDGDSDADEEANEATDGDDEQEGDTEWIEHEVDSKTVDLTELQGDNATLLQNVTVPAGEYEKVFVHVSDVNGTLKTGEQVNVKLPSQKLHLNEDFTVDSESDVEFVFDITVFEAGNSGKYILKPVASESGTDVPIERVDEEAEANLEANFVGDVTAGENATVKVTQNGEPVANATVTVDDADVTVTTDADGTATVQVPADTEELEVEASTAEDSEYGEGEAELELEFGDDGESDTDEEREADGDDSESDGDDSDNSETAADGEADLAAALDGSLTAGENATITVTDGDGEPVEDATVAVDGAVVGETNADGELTFTVPEDVGMNSAVTVTSDGDSVTIEAGTVAAAS